MEGGRCIIRPPTTPASNIIVTLEPEKAEQAAFLTGSSSFVLIGFVTGKFSILFQLGSLVGPVIQANGRLSFEDDLRSGGLLLLCFTVNLRLH